MVAVKLVGLGIAVSLLLMGAIVQYQRHRSHKLQLEKWQREWDGEEGYDEILGIRPLDTNEQSSTDTVDGTIADGHQADLFTSTQVEQLTDNLPLHLREELMGDIFVLNVLAKPHEHFVGYELHQALLSAGLRFGQMNIFHSYAEATMGEYVTFSVAQAAEPGTFDIENMGAVSCVGLTLFTQFTGGLQDPQNLSSMVESAQQLAVDLGGDVCDKEQNPIDVNTLQALAVCLKEMRRR